MKIKVFIGGLSCLFLFASATTVSKKMYATDTTIGDVKVPVEYVGGPARPNPAQRKVKAATKKEAIAILRRLIKTYPQEYIATKGLSAGKTQRLHGKVWATAVYDGVSPVDRVVVGFYSVELEMTGQVTGVTMTATINITDIASSGCHLAIGVLKNNSHISTIGSNITSAGNHSVTSDPFTIEPNCTYRAQAYVLCNPTAGSPIKGVIATFTEIKFNL